MASREVHIFKMSTDSHVNKLIGMVALRAQPTATEEQQVN